MLNLRWTAFIVCNIDSAIAIFLLIPQKVNTLVDVLAKPLVINGSYTKYILGRTELNSKKMIKLIGVKMYITKL